MSDESPIELNNNQKKRSYAFQMENGDFKPEEFYEPRPLEAKLHPTVNEFFELTNENIINRFKKLNPLVDTTVLRKCLEYKPVYFKFAATDLFKVIDSYGKQQMIIIETNSCPFSQSVMPLLSNSNYSGGYRALLEGLFKKTLDETLDKSQGDLAIIHDDTSIESAAYCAAFAELTNEKVWLIEYHLDDKSNESKNLIEWKNGIMYVRDNSGKQHPIRACFRNLGDKPWKTIPLKTKTLVVNPIISCLAGGRNKITAAFAYKMLNEELEKSGIAIRMPKTVMNINKKEVPSFVRSMGGLAVVKEPYGNSGSGISLITNEQDLQGFMDLDHYYDKFIVQSLVGLPSWQKTKTDYNYYQIGNIPDENNQIYCFDVRMTVYSDGNEFKPLTIMGRKARMPLVDDLDEPSNKSTPWDLLGTNIRDDTLNNKYGHDSNRIFIMDNEGFNQLGLSIDDLIDAYIQSVLCVIAIDKMCIRLLNTETQTFDYKLFKELNFDDNLLNEIRI